MAAPAPSRFLYMRSLLNFPNAGYSLFIPYPCGQFNRYRHPVTQPKRPRLPSLYCL